MTQHTPGPWELWGVEYDDVHRSSFRALRRDIDWLGDILVDDEQGEANARLIEAAPELLDACEGLIESLTNSDHGMTKEQVDATEAADVVIAKILGDQ